VWDGCIEAGHSARIVTEDYVHVIGSMQVLAAAPLVTGKDRRIVL
jgi:hypothetical protein